MSAARAIHHTTQTKGSDAFPDEGTARCVPYLVLLFFFSIATLGQVVLFEPAPVDVVLTGLGVILIILGLRLSFVGVFFRILYLGLSGLPLIIHHVSTGYAVRYFTIETYLIFSSLVLFSLLTRWPGTQRLLVRWIAIGAAVGSILILFVHFFTYASSWFNRQGVRFRLKGAFAVLVCDRRILRIGTTTRALLLLVTLIAAVVMPLQVSGVDNRILAGIEPRSRYQSYDTRRFDVLGESVKEGLASPMGLGAGEFRQKYGISAHDLFLGKAVDAGTIPAVMMVLFVVLAAYRLFKACRKSGDQLSFALLIALAAQMATSTTIYSHHWRHLWVIVVLGLARTHTQKERENVPPAVLPGTGPVAAPSPVSRAGLFR